MSGVNGEGVSCLGVDGVVVVVFSFEGCEFGKRADDERTVTEIENGFQIAPSVEMQDRVVIDAATAKLTLNALTFLTSMDKLYAGIAVTTS